MCFSCSFRRLAWSLRFLNLFQLVLLFRYHNHIWHWLLCAKNLSQPVVVVAAAAHAFNPSTWETEPDRSLSSKTAWSRESSRTVRATQKPCLRKKKIHKPVTQLASRALLWPGLQDRNREVFTALQGTQSEPERPWSAEPVSGRPYAQKVHSAAGGNHHRL